MKRLTSLLMASLMVTAVLFASLLPVSAAETTVITLEAPEAVTYAGDAVKDFFEVKAILNPADGIDAIAGYRVTLTWDPTLLMPVDIFTSGEGFTDKKLQDGSLTLAVVNAENLLSDRLFSVSFIPLADGAATVDLEVIDMTLADGLIDATGDSVSVKLKKKPTFLFGDVTGDGKVNAIDYARLKAYLLGARSLTDDELLRSDITGDGKINALDYARLKAYLLGTWKPAN